MKAKLLQVNTYLEKRPALLDILLILLLLSFSPLFFYKLGQTSLISWDEAWYAQIAKNILSTGDLFTLIWNGKPFHDHPPVGYWIMALNYQLFGVNEFTTRLGSAVFGLICLVSTYFLGKELFNRTIGFASAVALCSSFWFLYRSRSGDLDIFLTTFFVLTLLFAVKASKNIIYLIPFSVFFTLLLLTKTLVPLTIIPALIVIFVFSPTLKKIRQTSLSKILITLIPSILFFLILVITWFKAQSATHPKFIERYLAIGLPGVKAETVYLDNLKITKEFLYNGIGKWFWPGIFSLFLGNLTFRKKSFLILITFFISFTLPFLFSSRGQIWHLIPVHPIMLLALFGFFYYTVHIFIKKPLIISVLTLGICFYFTFVQLRQAYYQFIDIPAFVSDEAILSKQASKFPEDLYIDDNFLPTAIFYSNKNVEKIWSVKGLFEDKQNFLLITYQYRVDRDNIPQSWYRIIGKDRDKILIQRI